MRFGTWNVRSMYRPRPLTTVARKVVKYRLDSVGKQEVGWDKGGATQERIILFLWRECDGWSMWYIWARGVFIHSFDRPEGTKQI
jgi:hypothetical protein